MEKHLTIEEIEILYNDIIGRTDEYGSDEEDRTLIKKLEKILENAKNS